MQWQNNYIQLSKICYGMDGTVATPFACFVPSWVQLVRYFTILQLSSPTSSVLELSECQSSSNYDIPSPYIPLTISPTATCQPILFDSVSQHVPFPYGSYAAITLYPSMSGACNLTLSILIGSFNIDIQTTIGGTQSITSELLGNWSGNALIGLLQPTILWVAIDTAGYVLLGVGAFVPPAVGTATVFNTLLRSAMPIPAPDLVTVQSYNSDWQVAIQWQPLTGLCRNYNP